MSDAAADPRVRPRLVLAGAGDGMMKIASAFAQCPFCGTEHSYAITDQAGKKKEAPRTCGMLACGKKAGEAWAK